MKKVWVLVVVLLVGVAVLLAWPYLSEPRPEGTDVTTPTDGSDEVRVTLHWIDVSAKHNLDGNTLKAGKSVRMKEIYNGWEGPGEFKVYEIFEAIIDDWLNRRGKVRPITTVQDLRLDGSTALSESPWSLPVTNSPKSMSTYVFRDDRGFESGIINSTRLGNVDYTAYLKGALQGNGIIETEGGLEATGKITFVIDPKVRVVPLIPWGEGDANLMAYLQDYTRHLSSYAEVTFADFREEFSTFLPNEAPEGWKVGEPLVENAMEVAMFTVPLSMPTSGKTLFAVKVVAEDDPTQFVVSDIIGIDNRGPTGTGRR